MTAAQAPARFLANPDCQPLRVEVAVGHAEEDEVSLPVDSLVF
jgi:hypothetical protein